MPLLSVDSATSVSDDLPSESSVTSLVHRTVTIERISVYLDQLGPLPSIALEVVNLTNNPDSDAAQLEKSISRDPVITAKVFKLANSAFYCPGNPSQSLRDAGARLGMQTIKNLVLSSCAGKMMAQPLKRYPYEGYGMWVHSLAVGLSAMMVVKEMGISADKRDDLFLAGMMHDIGKLIVDPLLSERINYTGSVSAALEEKLLGFNHTQMGVEIAERWNLPEVTLDVIRHHHSPDCAHSNSEVVAAIHLIDSILNRNLVGLCDDAEADRSISFEALEVLSLSESDFDSLSRQITEQLPEIMVLCSSIS